MKKALFSLALLALSSQVLAEPVQCSRDHLSVIEALKKKENRLAFANDGGLANGGVCWWHSRLERSAAYLAEFRPDLPKPSVDQLSEKLRDLTLMRAVVIPGYKNLEDMSKKNEQLVQKTLNAWQVRDGFMNQAWVRGLFGRVHMKADKLEARMNMIYDKFQKEKRPYFLMLQLPAIVAHAFLLLDMEKTSEGYTLYVVDSNDPGAISVQKYKKGSHNMSYYGDPYIPYLGFKRDYNRMNRELSDLCHKGQNTISDGESDLSEAF